MLHLKIRTPILLLAATLITGTSRADDFDRSYSSWLREMDLVLIKELPPNPDFDDYLSLMASKNPELRSRYHQWQAAEKKIKITEAWADPQVRVSAALQPLVTAQGPQTLRIGVSQLIPRPKEIRSASEAQTHISQASYSGLQTHLLDLSLNLKTSYSQSYLLGQKLEIQKQIKLLLSNWQQVLLTRYRSASAGHPDLVKTQLELLRLDDQIRETEVDLTNSLDDLRILLNLDASVEIPVPTELDTEVTPVENGAENPLILRQQAYLNAAKSGEGMAKSRTRPQVMLGLDWLVVGSSDIVNPALVAGQDAFSLNVGLSLPVWGKKNKAGKATARSILLAEEAKYEALQHDLLLRTGQAQRDLQNAERRIKLLEQSLIPKSQEVYQVLETAYTAGNADLYSLLDAVENLLDHQLQLVEAEVTLWQAQARLNHLKGSTR